MFQIIPQCGLPPHAVQQHIFDALESLRCAEFKLNQAVKQFAIDESVQIWQVREYRASIRLHIAVLAELVSGEPSLDRDVFKALRLYRNRTQTKVPHTEGAILSLMLATQCMEEAIEESEEPDLVEMLEALVFGSRTIGEWLQCLLPPSDFDEILESILEGPIGRFRVADAA